MKAKRLAILASHPIQYQAPLFRELAQRLDLVVFYAYRAKPVDQAKAGFGVDFEWDVDLLSGYECQFLENASRSPGLEDFSGCDTPSIGVHLARSQSSVLLVMGWHLKSYWQGIWAARRAGIPVMVRGDSHLDTPRSVFKRTCKALVYPIALRAFDAALYVGVRSRRYWEHYGYPEDRLFSSPHCVDNAWFANRASPQAGLALRNRHGIATDAKVVLFAGKIMDLKRPLDLIAAAGMMTNKFPGLTVLVAGTGALGGQMSAAAESSGVNLVHLGFCNQGAMPEAYAAADLLVLPSESETWGLVANEALASGCPIVVSDACGCAPDLAADSLVGRVFPVGNVELLASAIADVLNSPPAPADVARKASQYDVETAAKGICLAVDNVAA